MVTLWLQIGNNIVEARLYFFIKELNGYKIKWLLDGNTIVAEQKYEWKDCAVLNKI